MSGCHLFSFVNLATLTSCDQDSYEIQSKPGLPQQHHSQALEGVQDPGVWTVLLTIIL